MTVIELLMSIAILIIIYYMIKRQGHTHKFVHMYNTPDNEYNWFYCVECMIQGCAHINNSGSVEIQYFNTKSVWKKK